MESGISASRRLPITMMMEVRKMAFASFGDGPMGSLQAARGQARIESYEQMLELIDLAKKDGFFD